MTNEELTTQLAEIKGQLNLITEELASRRRRRQELQELQDDLSHVARDVFQTAVVELEDVAPFVNTGDFLHLIKKILRNTNTISATISKFEGALDFVDDFKPIGNDMFKAGLQKLDELERKGYFRFARELQLAVDEALGELSPEDMSNLARNIVQVVKLTRVLANSNLIPALATAANELQEIDATRFEKFNPLAAHKALRKPEMRRAVGMSLHFLKRFVKESNNHNKGDA